MAVQGNRFLVEPYDTFGSKVQNLDCGHSLDEPAQVCSHHLTSALGWDGCRFLGFYLTNLLMRQYLSRQMSPVTR
jgi:hypothetical protein